MFTGDAVSDLGEVERIAWTCWEIATGAVFFELNRPMIDLHAATRGKAPLEVSTFVCQNKPLFKVLLTHIGAAELEGHLTSSRLASRRADAAVGTGDFAKESYCMSAVALLLLLSWYALAKRAHHAKAKSKALLLVWLRAGLRSGAGFEEVFMDTMEGATELCDESAGQQGVCCHASSFLEEVMRAPAGDPDDLQNVLNTLLKLLATSHIECPALSFARSGLIKDVAKRFEGGCCDDRFLAKVGDLMPEGDAKRRKIDADFKQTIVNEVLQERRCKSGAAALRVMGGVDDSLARRWEAKEMSAYQLTAVRISKGIRQISISSDAARLGEPAEETVLFAMWLPQAEFGVMGVPQALPETECHTGPQSDRAFPPS